MDILFKATGIGVYKSMRNLVCFISVSFSLWVHAEEAWVYAEEVSGHAEEVSWKQCVQETSENNLELRAARDSVRAAHDAAWGAYSGFLPQLSGNLGDTYSSRASSGASLSTSLSTSSLSTEKNNYTADLSVNQNLFSGFQDKAKVVQAEVNEQIAKATLDASKAKVSLDLKTIYGALLFGGRADALQEKIASRRKENLRLVQLRFESGRENSGSVLLSKAYLAEAEYGKLQAQNVMEVSSFDLARVLGRSDPSALAVREDIPFLEPPTSLQMESLTMHHPDVRIALAQAHSSEAALTLARSGFFPSLSVSGSVSREGPNWFPDSNRWSMGLNLSIPIFNGGKDLFESLKASASLAASRSLRQNVEYQTKTKIRQSLKGFIEAVEKLKVDESFLKAAHSRAEIARGKYNTGLMTFDDWDLIENDLITREKAELSSQKSLVLAQASWEQAEGKGVLP